MKFITIFNNNITLISLFINILFIIKCIQNIFNFIFKEYCIKKVLDYNNNLVNICCYDKSTNYISIPDIEATNNIINLFNEINQKFQLAGTDSDENNEMCIGGFLVSNKINSYFVRYFNDFKFITTPEMKATYGNNPFIEYIPDKYGYRIKDREFPLTAEIDYAFLIKLTRNDFSGADKTVHIIHGTNEVGTIRASEFLTTHYKQIYKKYKGKHYFFAIEIIRHDSSINYSKGIIDLTDIVFKENPQ